MRLLSLREEANMFVVGIVLCLLHTLTSTDAAFNWIHVDASVDFLEGQTAKLVWTVDTGTKWGRVDIVRNKIMSNAGDKKVIDILESTGTKTKHLSGRDQADVDLVVQGAGNVANVTFTLRSLVKTIDEMYYSVKLTASVSFQSEARYTFLRVLVPPGKPVLQLQSDKSDFCRNDTINITCNGLSGHPPPMLTFLQNDSTIGMLNGTTSGNYTKAVLSHALTQPGTLKFSCQATNPGGSSPTSDIVTKMVKDPPVITNCKNKKVVEKTNLTLTCDVSGSQPLTISWFKGNTSTVFQSGKSLRIDAVNRNDSGKYIFTASNGGECPTAKASVYIHVQLKQYKVNCSCRFTNYTYVKNMSDINSNVSKTHQAILGNVIEEGYKGYKYFKSVKVLSLYNGSVIVNFQLELTANVSDPLLPLKEALNNSGGALGGYSIDPNSIQQEIYVPPTTPPASTTTSTPPPASAPTEPPPEPSPSPSPSLAPTPQKSKDGTTISYVAIIGIAIGCCVLLIILVITPVVYCCYCKKRRECKVVEDREEVLIVVPMEGIDNKGSSHSPSTYAKHGPGTNNAENCNDVCAQVDKSKHGPGANGNNNAEKSNDVYAQVDKSKKKKKKTDEVLYADLSLVRGDNKSGAVQLAPMTSSGNQPEKHESNYAEVITFRSSEKPIGNESANNSNKNEKNPVPPGPPNVTVINIEATTVTVRWTRPAYDGGNPVIDYILEIQPEKGKVTVNGKGESHPVTGLTKDTKYEVKLYARNVVGYGKAATTTFRTRKQGPPAQPIIESAVVNQTSVALTWLKPEENDGEITGYTVYKKVKDQDNKWEQIAQISGIQVTYTVKNLERGKTYLLIVTGTNKFGESDKDDSKAKIVKIPFATAIPPTPSDDCRPSTKDRENTTLTNVSM